MEKSIDLAIFDFKQSLIKTINESKLPLSIVSFVINDIQQTVDGELNKRITEEQSKLEPVSDK